MIHFIYHFMRQKFILIFSLLLITLSAQGVDIPKGTFYFDNSKTQYANVKFIYGSDTSNETYVVSMTQDAGSIWKINMETSVANMYRYTFANTTLPDGKISASFTSVKDDISNNRGEYRTATTDAAITVGYTYTPATADNWAQGTWVLKLDSTHPYSGKLPVLHINTTDGAAITSKEEYLTGTYYLDNMGLDGYQSIGSESAPLTLQIKGRGNYTWTGFDKKPYRIKLDASAALLGMKSSKHFVLLAHADDNMAFLRNTVGFELSRLLGLPYTPSQRPVEVILNGDYIGLYLLTENIRVDSSRVNIAKQADSATDSEAITGGWLVEIDNYDDPSQIKITEGNGSVIRFTYQAPEVLSTEQTNYLTQQVTLMNNAIYSTNKNSTTWEDYIDMNTLAKFYIVQEVMDNAESFHGSCYMYKNKGVSKWMFGPVWDFGNAYHRGTDKFIYTDPPFGQTWIGEIAKYPRFQDAVTDLWKVFKGNQYPTLDSFIDNFISQIAIAAQYDAQRWPKYGNADVTSCKNNFVNYMNQKVSWLVKQWGEGVAGLDNPNTDDYLRIINNGNGNIIMNSDKELKNVRLYNISGGIVAEEAPNSSECTLNGVSGLYIITATSIDGQTYHKKVLIK